MTTSIHELMAKFSAEEIVFQMLDHSTGEARILKDGTTKLTVYTNQVTPQSLAFNTGKVGLLLWLPREHWEQVRVEIVGKMNQEQAPQPKEASNG